MTSSILSTLRCELLASVAGLLLSSAGMANADGHLAKAEPQAKYAVGITANFVRDFSKPFDAWGRKYKTDEYRTWLNEVEATGTPRTTVTQIYYPTPKGEGLTEHGFDNVVPSKLPVATAGTEIEVADLYFGKTELAKQAFFAGSVVEDIYMAHEGVPVADGNFPLVIMVHGLGGSLNTWATAAEYLAAQGYVVVTVTMTSDSAMAPVFEDPESPWARQATPERIRAAYELRAANSFDTVMRNFFGFMFDYHEPVPFRTLPDPAKLKVTPEGAKRTGQLMADLFDQRVEDVARVITEMKYLNESKLDCEVGLVSPQNPEPLCGFFSGRLDVDNLGVMGHSLGSMTAQAAAAFLGDVDTAVGFNNGLPRMWEPYGGFPGDPSDAMPAGVPKPFLQVIGSDDFFIHHVFRQMHWTLIERAGGNPHDFWMLEAERTWPSDDDPQADALSSYKRATAEKMLLIFRDEDHSTAVDDWVGVYQPGRKLTSFRLPPSPDVEPEEYEVLGWIKDGDKDVYLPHLMRHYFVTNWFDWQPKGDQEARHRLVDHPFSNGVKAMRSEGVEAE